MGPEVIENVTVHEFVIARLVVAHAKGNVNESAAAYVVMVQVLLDRDVVHAASRQRHGGVSRSYGSARCCNVSEELSTVAQHSVP